MSLLLPETVDEEQQPPKNRHTPPDSHQQHHQQQIKSLNVSTTLPVIVGSGGGGSSNNSSGGGNIRVKSNENLFENYKPQNPLPHKANRQTAIDSDIVTKNSVANQLLTKAKGGLPPPLEDTSSCCIIDDDDDDYDEYHDEIVEYKPKLPPSLKYNSNTMTISVKPITTTKRSNQLRKIEKISRLPQSQATAADNFENIICSPNLIEIPYMDDEYDVDDDMQTQEHTDSGYICDDVDISNATESNADEPMPQLIPFGLLQNSQVKNESFGAYPHSMPKNLFASTAYRRSMGNLAMTHNNGKSFSRKILLKKEGMTLLNNGDTSQSPSAVVLRNPRGNQPRTYTTDALYAALMDVKEGESIYR